jgi:hypothetical protein
MAVTKLHLSTLIVNALFQKQLIANTEDIVNMFDKNNSLVNGYFDIIVYDNHQYRRSPRVKSWSPCIKLHDELAPEMEKHVTERDRLCADKRTIEAWFRELCSACLYVEGVLKHLPECMRELLPDQLYSDNRSSSDEVNLEKLNRALAKDEIYTIVAERKMINILLG